jgi:AcrR family transcriptional regulator
MPKAFTENERNLINRRLMDEGMRMFSTFGLKKTSVEELANAAGISKAAFYLFFDSKEALFMDVVEVAELHFRSDVLAELETAQGSPRQRLTSVFLRAFSLWRPSHVTGIHPR